MTTSQDLLDLVVATLTPIGDDPAPTSAGPRVYRPGDWPTQNGQYPIWKLRVVTESKQSLGHAGAPQFTVTTTVRAVGEVSAPVQVNDAGAAAAEAALWQLQREFEVAVIGSYPLTAAIQQIASVNSQLSYNSEGETHLAGIQIDLALEFYQGPEDFAPVRSDEVDIVAAVPIGGNFGGFTLHFSP